MREIERSTREQHRSPLTASLFGQVLHRHADTPLDSLVLCIIEPKQFISPATEYGKKYESPTTLEEYKVCRKCRDITVCSAGFVIYKVRTLEQLQTLTSMIQIGKSSMG